MIQAAQIGCGISGREGRAAVLASDYAFAQFRCATRHLFYRHQPADFLLTGHAFSVQGAPYASSAQCVLESLPMCTCRFVTRLLLLHGRWSYKRNAEIVQYAFYKNLVYSLPNVYFGIASGELVSIMQQPANACCQVLQDLPANVCMYKPAGFSAQPIFSTALMATFNICWCAPGFCCSDANYLRLPSPDQLTL